MNKGGAGEVSKYKSCVGKAKEGGRTLTGTNERLSVDMGFVLK